MKFTGRYDIPAPVESVWTALMDPEVLRYCIPGCEKIEKTSPTEFAAVATLRIGPVKASFRGRVVLSDMNPPHRCTLSGEGQGGVAGFAKGSAEVVLSAEEDSTALTYTATATVGGKLAQIGQRLIDGAAKQIADDFFSRFTAALTKPESSGVLEPDPPVAPQSSPPPRKAVQAARERAAPEIWILGLVGVVVILLAILGTVL